MCSTNKKKLTGSLACMLIAIVCNIKMDLCFAQPLDQNTTLSQQDSTPSLNETSKPLIPTDGEDETTSQFPDRRGFFTGHRIPLELFPQETLRNIELVGEQVEKESQALERVPPGYPRRIPLELFSEESLKRIDGQEEEDKEVDNFPRRVPLELFDDESLKRLDLLHEKEQTESAKETSNPTSIRGKVKSYVDSDFLRASDDELKELKRTPRRIFTVHGGLDYDPEAIAHNFPALTIGGEGDPAFLDTLLSYYN